MEVYKIDGVEYVSTAPLIKRIKDKPEWFMDYLFPTYSYVRINTWDKDWRRITVGDLYIDRRRKDRINIHRFYFILSLLLLISSVNINVSDEAYKAKYPKSNTEFSQRFFKTIFWNF